MILKFFTDKIKKGFELLIGVVSFGFLVIIVVSIVGGLFEVFNEKKEGIVNYEDCREFIKVKPDDIMNYFRQFTCNYEKTKGGEIMGGECVYIKMSGGFFSSKETCRKAYIYKVKQANVCPNPKFPVLGYDDKCHEE